jgi:hypothetical protein
MSALFSALALREARRMLEQEALEEREGCRSPSTQIELVSELSDLRFRVLPRAFDAAQRAKTRAAASKLFPPFPPSC